MRRILPIVSCLLLAPIAVVAAPDCRKDADQTSLDVCAGSALRDSDLKLNQTYRALLAAVGTDGRTRLQKAENAWLVYRDAQCDFDTAGHADGSIYPMIKAECLDALTQAQTRQLAAQLHCEEGDMSCGGQ